MIDAFMEECRYFKLNEEVGFFYHDHCIVSKHHNKQEQPISMNDLQLRVFKKLNNAILHKERKRNVCAFTLMCDVHSPSPIHIHMNMGTGVAECLFFIGGP